VTVGDYRCLALDDARGRIEAADLVLGTVLPPAPESDGSWLVIDQEPRNGAQSQPGGAVRVWVVEATEDCD
jgi:beta-lactam-binding protein with PASTA domain